MIRCRRIIEAGRQCVNRATRNGAAVTAEPRRDPGARSFVVRLDRRRPASDILLQQKQLNPMKSLPAVQRKFILHWGEMGTRWGVNRTVTQLHALLYLSPRPLNADDIVDALDIARSNVSTSLKELQSWGIVRLVHVDGDKRDHFESMKDVWEMFRVVLDERKKREYDPTLRMLHECVVEAAKDKSTDAYTEKRLRELYKFFETTTAWYGQVRSWPTAAIVKFVKLGDKGLKLLGVGG